MATADVPQMVVRSSWRSQMTFRLNWNIELTLVWHLSARVWVICRRWKVCRWCQQLVSKFITSWVQRHTMVNSWSPLKFIVVRQLTLFRSSSGLMAGSQQSEFRTVDNIVRNKLTKRWWLASSHSAASIWSWTGVTGTPYGSGSRCRKQSVQLSSSGLKTAFLLSVQVCWRWSTVPCKHSSGRRFFWRRVWCDGLWPSLASSRSWTITV